MSHRLIIGAGPIGTALARQLTAAGDTLTVITRSGRGLDHPSVTRVAGNAADPALLAGLAEGADTVFNCANPGTYMQWEEQWPPLAAAILAAAESSGAVLVTLSNLYGYGPVDVPITPELPLAATGHKGQLRARMWQEALAAHRAGRVRATEVRAADYLGPEVTTAGGLLHRYADAALRGRTAWVFGNPEVPHSFSSTEDTARLLAVAADDERAWGQAWHVPGDRPRSIRRALTDLIAAADDSAPAGSPAATTGPAATAGPRIRRVPRAAVTALGPVMPIMRELSEVLWQFERPFEIDASATTETFGLTGTPWPELIADTAPVWAQEAEQAR